MLCFKKQSYSLKNKNTNNTNNTSNTNKFVTLKNFTKQKSIKRKSSKEPITIKFSSNLNKKH